MAKSKRRTGEHSGAAAINAENLRDQPEWYSVRLLLVSRVGGEWSPRPLWEERVVLLKARSDAEARRLGAQYASAEGHSYGNEYGQHVEWLFHSIEDVQHVGQELSERGWEVMHRFIRYRMMPDPKAAESTKAESPTG